MRPILPAVRHRPSVVHWRGFRVAREDADLVLAQPGC